MSLITPEATLSFPALFAPRKVDPADESEVPKYSATLIFDEEAQADPLYVALKAAAVEAAVEEFGPDAQEMLVSGKLNWPFLAGKDASAPEGTTVLRVRSKNAPGVVSIIPGTDGRPAPITNPEEMYAGAQVRASLGVFAYNMAINKGVSFGLNNIQKIADGERLDGRVPAADEFDADASLAADLSAMDADTDADGQPNPPAATTPGRSLAQLL